MTTTLINGLYDMFMKLYNLFTKFVPKWMKALVLLIVVVVLAYAVYLWIKAPLISLIPPIGGYS